MNKMLITKSHDEVFFEIFLAALSGSSAIAATRHDTQSEKLINKAAEIASAGVMELERDNA